MKPGSGGADHEDQLLFGDHQRVLISHAAEGKSIRLAPDLIAVALRKARIEALVIIIHKSRRCLTQIFFTHKLFAVNLAVIHYKIAE